MSRLAQIDPADIRFDTPVRQTDMTAVLGRPLSYRQAYDYVLEETDGFAATDDTSVALMDRLLEVFRRAGLIDETPMSREETRTALEGFRAAMPFVSEDQREILQTKAEAFEALLSLPA